MAVERASGGHDNRLRDAALTLAAVVLAYLALDDITTDRDSSLFVERLALGACGLWFAMLAWRLIQQGGRVIGLLSLGVVLTLTVAYLWIGPATTPSLAFPYLATTLGLLWFVAMSALLILPALRSKTTNA